MEDALDDVIDPAVRASIAVDLVQQEDSKEYSLLNRNGCHIMCHHDRH